MQLLPIDPIRMRLIDTDVRRMPHPIVASRREYPDGAREPWHLHEEAQFVFSAHGVLRVITPIGVWSLGPQRGLWLAPGIAHELHAVGDVSMHSVYFESDAAPWSGSECRVLAISPLLQALVAAMVEDKHSPHQSRLPLITPLLVNEIKTAPQAVGVKLPLPGDRRLRQICKLLIADPANTDSLGAWGDRVGASERTLARLFKDETGLTFGQWRQQLRLVEAVSRLAQGTPVATIAVELGYQNASAFITMFKKSMGETPQRYLKN
jgi:AraC-like DNA-binding protein